MVLGWLLLLSTSANAQLTIEITQGSDNPTPIAVVPFGAASARSPSAAVVSSSARAVPQPGQ